jgi:riboflavin kinase/FMN adenylyltransferase
MAGVYAGLATDETPGAPRRTWSSAISIGTAPTFGVEEMLIEAHLLSEDVPELPGRVLRLEFVQYLRDQRQFATTDELIAQIARDVEQTRALCHTLTPGSGFRAAAPFCPRD